MNEKDGANYPCDKWGIIHWMIFISGAWTGVGLLFIVGDTTFWIGSWKIFGSCLAIPGAVCMGSLTSVILPLVIRCRRVR